jgi:hypothetical protein
MDVNRNALARVVAVCAAIVLTGACASGAAPTVATGRVVTVTGIVRTGPTCPVMHEGSACAPRPAPSALITVYAQTDVVARASADGAGRFAVQLHPGSYRVHAQLADGLRSTASRNISVATAPVRVTFILDSGLR